MLAVLAMAFFPGLAQAEESSGIQYESEVPTVPKHESIPPAKPKGGSNTQPEAESESTGSNPPKGGGGGGNGGSNPGGGAHNGQSKQGSPGGNGSANNGSKSAGGNLSEAKPVANATHPAEESGSSSPLVPILIAIAVLAAISIGAFYFRQRRQGDNSSGSSVSPKAS
jgi:cobalamin biosynthesis Mg chelatase CobN